MNTGKMGELETEDVSLTLTIEQGVSPDTTPAAEGGEIELAFQIGVSIEAAG